MKKRLAILSVFYSLVAAAAPEEGAVTRFGVEQSTFQEPLRLQSLSGSVDKSVANYKGAFLTVERQKRAKGGGYGLLLGFGSGLASGGGTSENYNHMQGGVSWMMVMLEPRVIWTLSEQIDFALALAGTYRTANWDNSATMRVSPSANFGGVFFVDLDLALTKRLGLHQSFGFGAVEVGPFWRWGITYDL